MKAQLTALRNVRAALSASPLAMRIRYRRLVRDQRTAGRISRGFAAWLKYSAMAGPIPPVTGQEWPPEIDLAGTQASDLD